MNNPCPNCGTQIPYGARFFCASCGTHVFGAERAPSRETPRRKRPPTRPKDSPVTSPTSPTPREAEEGRARTARLVIRTTHWSGWEPGDVKRDEAVTITLTEDDTLELPGGWPRPYVFRLVTWRPDGVDIAPVGEAPAPLHPGGGIDLLGRVGETTLRVGQSASMATPTMDAGTSWEVELVAVMGPGEAPDRRPDGEQSYDAGSSGRAAEPTAFSYHFSAGVPNNPDRYQRKLEGRFDADEGAVKVLWGKTEGQQESQRTTVLKGDLYERLLEVARRTQAPELPPPGGGSFVTMTRADGTEVSGVPSNADDWDELWRAVAQAAPRRRNWLPWGLGAAVLLVACSLLVLLSLVVL